MSAWYYTKDGKTKIGPVTAAQLKELARSGQLGPTDMVRREDMPKWMPASRVQGIFPANDQAAPPPTPSKPVPPPPLPPPAPEENPPQQGNGILGVALATWQGWSWKVRAAVGGGLALFFILAIMCGGGGGGGRSGRHGKPTEVEDVDFSGVDYSVPEVDYSKGPNGETVMRRRGEGFDPHTRKPYTESGFERNGQFVRHGMTVFWNSISADRAVLEGDQKFGDEFYYDGKLHGRRTAWYDSLSGKQGPKKLETSFLDDLAHGKETKWYQNGNKESETYLYKDKKHGPFQNWWENGQQGKKGAYKDGQEHAKWTYWHENGKLKAEKTYATGKLHGRCVEYYANGEKSKEETIINGLNEGEFIRWHENGQKALEGSYKAGRKEGKWIGWHPGGEKALEGSFEEGSGSQTEYYGKESGGNVHAVVVFVKGEKVSELAYYPAITLGRRGEAIGPNHKMYEMKNGRMTQYDVDGSVK